MLNLVSSLRNDLVAQSVAGWNEEADMSQSNDQPQRRGLGRRNFFKMAGGALGVGAVGYYLGLRDQPPVEVPHADYPDYRDGDSGLPSMRGPFLQESQLAAFQFEAGPDQLTSLCDRYLNLSNDQPFRYVLLTPNVILTYADMVVSSLDERDQQVGQMSEIEVGFWVLTLALRQKGHLAVPDHIACFLPYLFVDNSHVITTGREVYGFNKQIGQFQKPPNIQIPEFSVDVLGVKAFAPETHFAPERLLEMHYTMPGTSGGSPTTWDSWAEAKSRFEQDLLKQMEVNPENKWVELGTELIKDNVPVVFLKQFRDAADSHRACYQAVVEAPIQIRQFQQGGFLAGQYTLRINQLASHPVAQTLGLRLENGEQQPLVGAWLKANFVMGEGAEIWKAT